MLLEGSSKVSEAEVLHRDLPCYWLLEIFVCEDLTIFEILVTVTINKDL